MLSWLVTFHMLFFIEGYNPEWILTLRISVNAITTGDFETGSEYLFQYE
jgi:hypothetical protein